MAASRYLLALLSPLALAVLASPLLVRGESCGAVTHAEPGDDFSSLMAKTIANFEANCRGKKKHENDDIEGRVWPRGVYGLPMPIGGCPTGSDFEWKTGSRLHDTEDTDSNNQWSSGLHLKGPYSSNNMWQLFCMKTVDRVAASHPVWPNGQYCVFKYGQNCPSGMSSGSILWDDEDTDNDNSVNGTVPSGVYDQDTLIYFCCMTDGNASAPITLPSHSPIYLFPYTAQCQEVQGMAVSQEWFQWDENNLFPKGSSTGTHPYNTGYIPVFNENHKVHFCYYDYTI